MQWLHRLRTYRFDEPTMLSGRIAELIAEPRPAGAGDRAQRPARPRALPALKRLGQRHDFAVLQLRDPAERRLRGVGFVRRARGRDGPRRSSSVAVAAWLDQAHARRRTQASRASTTCGSTPTGHSSPASDTSSRSRNLLGRGAR